MEKFKAVEKEMKTKAYSKEGLSAAAKLDPKEKEKLEACQFVSSMVEDLERQIETIEVESEGLQVTVKKGKKDLAKANRLAEIEEKVERHKWHQTKLELILRLLENGNLEPEQVMAIEESIRYYVTSNTDDPDFMEDDAIYDELNLEEEENAFGMTNDMDRASSQDAQSIQDDAPDTDTRGGGATGKQKAPSISESTGSAVRRPSMHTKSPLPTLATLHNPTSSVTNNTNTSNMKPAPLPTRAPGETLKYASAAAAAAASDKSNVGIAPLPPPPGSGPSPSTAIAGLAPLPPAGASKASSTSSPNTASSVPASVSQGAPPRTSSSIPANVLEDSQVSSTQAKSPAMSQASIPQAGSVASSVPQTPALEKVESASSGARTGPVLTEPNVSNASRAPSLGADESHSNEPTESSTGKSTAAQINGDSAKFSRHEEESDESIYHLPPGLQDLIQSFEATKTRVTRAQTTANQRLLAASHANCPDSTDAEKPRHYKPQTRYNTPPHYPQEPLPIFDDPRLYSRIDTDTLFYVFYYRQNTYQQYLAAKSLKGQSWRFHKQYQTWFQRHEEPKTITEEYEQGTYRFFDYESTWLV